MHLQPSPLQIGLVAGVFLVVVVLLLCVFAPWDRPAPKIAEDTGDVDDVDDEGDEPAAEADAGYDESGSKAVERDDMRDEQARHRAALMHARAPGRRMAAAPTTSAVVLAAMRSPTRSRSGGTMDFIDDYDIKDVAPADLSRQ